MADTSQPQDETVEAVAEALWYAFEDAHTSHVMPWKVTTESARAQFRNYARAVIPLVAKAQREADVAAMKNGGRDQIGLAGLGYVNAIKTLDSLPLISEEATRGD